MSCAADILVDATLQRVWELHTDISAWSAWQTDITASAIDGLVEPGTVFHWSTFGLDIDSTIYAVDAPHRILWGGPAHGITGVHLWTFTEVDGKVHVHTEESWDGVPIRADIAGMHAALDGSLAAWLEYLKKTTESA
ncbi:SRPBCC family protein [Nocardia sp. CWNU-33]|uniref:SRPBCC family protein n=1 Tax=Nocardia sp. CWNU-33 TaxID=3392117 RepID=UPI00398F6A17